VVEKVTNKDWKWFFNQWLYQPGIPQLEFTFRKEKTGITLNILQKQNLLYSFPLTIAYVVDFGRICLFKKILISALKTSIKLPANTEKIYTGVNDILAEGVTGINIR